MATYNVVVKVGLEGVEKIDQGTAKLDDMGTAAGQARDALGRFGAAGAQGGKQVADGMSAAATAAQKAAAAVQGITDATERGRVYAEAYRKAIDEQWGAINAKKFDDENLRRINAPMEQFRDQVASLNRLLDTGKIAMGQYDDELARAEQALSKARPSQLSEEIQRETKLLEQIKGPLREYERDLAALDRLLKQGAIDAGDYHTQLDKLEKRVGPRQGPQQAGAASSASSGGNEGPGIGNLVQAVAPQFGQAGNLLSQFASGGAIAAAGVVALGAELIHVSDTYTRLTSSVERFTTSTESANDIVHQQLDLSKQLHSSLEGASALYVRARDATYELNLSSREQLGLAHDVGVEVASMGKGAEDAASLMRRLSLAFETGAISGRELRSIMREYPEVASAFAQSLGHSTAELIQMANKGQISAQQIIDAFHKMAPEAEKTLDRMNETFTQKAGHLWDSINVNVGGAIDWYKRQYKSYGEIADENAARARQGQLEQQRQLNSEMEKNARTAQIGGAAQILGIDFAPFSKEQADNYTKMRLMLRETGVDIADAFDKAKSQAQLYGVKIDEIKDQHAAKEIADDAKRIYDALYGADDILKAAVRQWSDIADKAKIAAEAATKFRAHPPPNISQPQRDQMQRDLDLAATNAQTGADDAQYGQKMVSYAQGLNTARAELERLTAAHKAGIVAGEDFRKQQEALLTTLNSGRLPEVIKLWDELRLPQQQFMRDNAALDSLLHTGAFTLDEYSMKLRELQESFDKSGLAKTLNELGDAQRNLQRLVDNYEAGRTTMSQDAARHAADVAHESMIDTRVAETEKQYKVANVDQADLEADIAAWNKRVTAINENLKVLDPLEYATRQHALMLQEEKKILEQINGAPIKDYQLGIAAANDLQAHGKLNAEQYAKAIDVTRLAYLQATPAAKTFAGAMEINWLKMKQDADSFGATVANQLVGDFGKLNDAIVTAANGGQVSWSSMADAMLQDLERVLLKMLEVKAISAGIGLLGSGAGDSIMDAGLVDEFATGMGYANGGSFIVGGSGGPDSKYVGMRVTPGEMVTVQTPGQQRQAAQARQQQPTVVVQPQIHNHYDTSIGVNAIVSPAGQNAMLNVMRANAPAVRAALGIKG